MHVKGVPPGRFTAPKDTPPNIQRIVETRVNKGMITTIDSADIEPGAMQLVLNGLCRFDKTSRRPGTVLLTPIKPNNLPVIKLAFIKQKDGTPNTLRMTPTTIHVRGDQQWYPIVISSPLLGTTQDKFNTSDVLNKFVFTNNGANPIQVIDFSLGTCSPLGNAFSIYGANPRYVFGFFNRVVGLALREKEETTAIWSADGVPDQFDPTDIATNNSAGSSPILDSPDDLSDFIKGGISFSNIAIIFREKSIWHATKQPIAQNPFYFYTAVPGVGCNCPFSIKIIGPSSVAWVDQRTKAIWAYTPGNIPEEIDISIRSDLFKSIQDPKDLFAAYNAIEHEYTVYIPGNGGVVTGWTYNFITKSWTKQEYLNLVSANDTELTTPGLTVDELTGTVDALVGTVDSLSKQDSELAERSYGLNDGNIIIEDPTIDTDAPGNTEFDLVLISKTFVMPEMDINTTRINIEYQCSRPTPIKLEYTKNNGLTWILAKIITPTVFNAPQLAFLTRRTIRARRFAWRLTASSSDITILGFEVYVTPSGDSNK